MITLNRLQENRGNPKKFLRQINRDIRNGEGLRVIKDLNGSCLTGKDAANYINTNMLVWVKRRDKHTCNGMNHL